MKLLISLTRQPVFFTITLTETEAIEFLKKIDNNILTVEIL